MNENITKSLKISKQIEAVSQLLQIASETSSLDDFTVDTVSELIKDLAGEQQALLSDGEKVESKEN